MGDKYSDQDSARERDMIAEEPNDELDRILNGEFGTVENPAPGSFLSDVVSDMNKEQKQPMKLFNCTIRLMDTGLPYKDLEDAKKCTQEWADEIASEQNCTVVDIEVMEDPY